MGNSTRSRRGKPLTSLQWRRDPPAQRQDRFMGLFPVLALLLFIAFYPLESGLPVARSYAQYLRWFKWVNF